VSDPALQPTHDDPHHLVRVALQETPADLVVLGGTLANVYTGELLDGWGVAVSGSRIALTGPEAERCVGEATTVVEARGQVIAPGFIDAHTHLDYIQRLDHYLAAAIPTGLTAFVTETPVLANVGGYGALAAFLRYLADLPIAAFATAPTIAYLCSDRGDGQSSLSLEEMTRLLEEPAVLGLGEIYWPALLEGRTDLRMLALGGGLVVAADGVVRAEIPLPVGGIISNEPIPILAEQINRFQRALRELGCIRENPFLAAQVLTFTAIPSLRIRERGLWDVRKGQPVPLIAEEEGA
jgi:adenine deaminase